MSWMFYLQFMLYTANYLNWKTNLNPRMTKNINMQKYCEKMIGTVQHLVF